jgi:hypothetical protein
LKMEAKRLTEEANALESKDKKTEEKTDEIV